MEESEQVQKSKAIIARIEKENVNVHQFFPVLQHSFQKPSMTEASNFWAGLVSSVSGKTKKPSKVIQPSTEITTNKKPIAIKNDDNDDNISLPLENDKEEPKNAPFDELRIFSPNTSSEELKVSTALSKAVKFNYDQEGYFETLENAEKCKRSNNIMRCQSLLDRFVWVSYKAQLEETDDAAIFTVENTSLTLIAKAKHDEKQDNYVGSLRKHNKIVALNPNDPFWIADRAEVFLRLGDLKSAIYDYRRAFHFFKSCFVFKFRLAKLYCFHGQVSLDMKMYRDALDSFIKAATLVPNQIVYKAKCCSCFISLGCFDKAWFVLNKLLSHHPNNMDLMLMRARLYHITGEYSSSFQDIKTVLNQGHHPVAATMLEQVIYKADQIRHEAINLNIQKQFYPAIKKINLAISLHPTDAKLYLLRGILHRHVEDFNSSIDDIILSLKKCSAAQRESIQKEAQHQLLLTFNDFSLECFSKGFINDAIQLLNKAIAGEKNEKGLYLNRAECFYQQMKYNFSLQDYQQALELDPDDMSILPKIASVYYLIGMENYVERNYQEALEKLTLAIEHAPTRGEYYITRCKCFQMLQNLYSARSDLLIGMQLVPNNREIVPLMAYLFPNISVDDIMLHPLAIQAKHIAHNLLSRPKGRHGLPPLANKKSKQGEDNCLEKLSQTSSKGCLSANMKASPVISNNSDFTAGRSSTASLVWEKKKINCHIQKTLKNFRALKPVDACLKTKSSSSKVHESVSENRRSKFAK